MEKGNVALGSMFPQELVVYPRYSCRGRKANANQAPAHFILSWADQIVRECRQEGKQKQCYLESSWVRNKVNICFVNRN